MLTFIVVAELQILSAISFLYIIWTHSTLSNVKNPPLSPQGIVLGTPALFVPNRPASPRLPEGNRRQPSPAIWTKRDFGYVWMSVPKNYR
jgi:hypothetical protein